MKKQTWKKIAKKIVTMLLILLMTVTMLNSFAVSVKAEEDSGKATTEKYSITIKKNANDSVEHTYKAYQVFKGDYAQEAAGETTNKLLSNIAWGDGVDTTNPVDGKTLIQDIQAIVDSAQAENAAENVKKPFTGLTDAKAIADKLAKFTNDSQVVVDFAAAVGKHVTGNGTIGSKNNEGNYVISNLTPGYYIVLDEKATGSNPAAYSRNILQVVGNVDIDTKEVIPTIDKRIGTDFNDGLTEKTASIGDSVPFVIKTAVPDMTGYKKYFFVVTDTLSKGLTFDLNSNDLEVKVGQTTLTKDSDYTVEKKTTNNNETELKIVFNDFYNTYKDQAGSEILITYTAKLNEQAMVAADKWVEANTNKVKLTYSNNPNASYSSGNEPNDTDPVGETTEKEVTVYDTKIKITKQDGAGSHAKLEGVKFTLVGTAHKKYVTIEEHFVESTSSEVSVDNKTYYLLLNAEDGSYYTTTQPTDEIKDKYVDTNKTYKKVRSKTVTIVDEPLVMEQTTNEDGVCYFNGLGVGDYKIYETETKSGYNLLTSPITVNIKAIEIESNSPKVSYDSSITTTEAGSGNVISLIVYNNKGTLLPGTGGIGTTIFYVLGSILVLGASVIMITRKRLSYENN